MRALAKQVAIVTGAANGIGRELAKQLSAAGCHLALADIDEAGLKSLKEDLNRRSSTISVHAIDVAREDSVKALVEDVVSIHQRISIVINNAGVSISAPFEKVKVEDFERLFATNFWGAIHLCRHSLRFLKAEPEARIVNVLSAFALLGVPSKTAYCSSKAALLGFSNSLYAELFDTGVRVAVAFPPAVDTNLVRKGMAYDEDQKR